MDAERNADRRNGHELGNQNDARERAGESIGRDEELAFPPQTGPPYGLHFVRRTSGVGRDDFLLEFIVGV